MTKGPPPGDPLTHYWLLLEMAQSIGLDLLDERDHGHVSDLDFHAMIARCRNCRWEHDGLCNHFLRQALPDEDAIPPVKCENGSNLRMMLEMMKDRQRPPKGD